MSVNDITGDAIRTRLTTPAFREGHATIFGEKKKQEKRWMIVKHADEFHWSHYFETNPADGLHLSYSAFNTHTGKLLGIQNYYTELDKANHDLKAMISTNPAVGYAVVPVL